MNGETCDFCDEKVRQEKFGDRMIKGYEAKGQKPWVFVPREPATFGHLVVVAGKHYLDISDEKLLEDPEHLKEVMMLINKLASTIKSLESPEGKKCERVYVATLCETEKKHLHFHLIPRFEGDREGFVYLFEKELEEERWIYDCEKECEDCNGRFKDGKCDKKNAKVNEGSGRILSAECILRKHKNMICSDTWAQPNEERKKFIKKIKEKIEKKITDP